MCIWGGGGEGIQKSDKTQNLPYGDRREEKGKEKDRCKPSRRANGKKRRRKP